MRKDVAALRKVGLIICANHAIRAAVANPQHYIADLLARIADHPARCIAELLPWNWQPLNVTRAAA